MNYFLSTGEPSGEMSAVLLARAIRTCDARAQFEGIGAARMRDEGVALWLDHRGWAGIGLIDALPRIPSLLFQMWRTAAHLARTKPDLVVLVDFGAFNLRLASTLRERFGYRGAILYLFPPAAWLDNERTARAVGRLTVPVSGFRHQTHFYQELGVAVRYFGHPLLDEYAERPPRPTPPPNGGTVALLPGSRPAELRKHVPLLLRALEQIRHTRPRLRAVVGAADSQVQRSLRERASRAGTRDVEVVLGARAAFDGADGAWVASGTAVLESVLLGVPTLAFYVMPSSAAWYARRVRERVYGGRFVTLPNLVAQEEIVPEYLQGEATPEALAAAMDRLLADPLRNRDGVARVRSALGPPGAMGRCAEFAVALATSDAA